MNQIIAGQWGTTRLQAFLIENGIAVDSGSGPGAAQVREGDFENTFLAVAGSWLDAFPEASIILSGMVGSTFGWRDAGYVECPARTEEVVREGVDIAVSGRTARIVRGMACTNIMGEPDVLRGEETELLGWQAQTSDAQKGLHIVCIPGTHAKWVILRDGVVESFLTSAAGELFAALAREGILIEEGNGAHSAEVFRHAVSDAAAPGSSLPHLLFTVRSRTVCGMMQLGHAPSRLSGLIIGADVAGAMRLIGDAIGLPKKVSVIGMPEIGARYVDALDVLGIQASILESRKAAITGFQLAGELITESEARL